MTKLFTFLKRLMHLPFACHAFSKITRVFSPVGEHNHYAEPSYKTVICIFQVITRHCAALLITSINSDGSRT